MEMEFNAHWALRGVGLSRNQFVSRYMNFLFVSLPYYYLAMKPTRSRIQPEHLRSHTQRPLAYRKSHPSRLEEGQK